MRKSFAIALTVSALASAFGSYSVETQSVPDPEPSSAFWTRALEDKRPLDIKWLDESTFDGVRIRALRFTGSLWTGQAHRVYALFACPDGPGPYAAILQLHGGWGTCLSETVAFYVCRGLRVPID